MSRNSAVVAAVGDMFFASKIEAAARHLGVDLRLLRDPDQLERELAEGQPSLVVFNLDEQEWAALEAIRRIKSDPRLASTAVVGFLRHTHVDLHREAEEAGCDRVMPRSEFFSELPRLLTGAGDHGA